MNYRNNKNLNEIKNYFNYSFIYTPGKITYLTEGPAMSIFLFSSRITPLVGVLLPRCSNLAGTTLCKVLVAEYKLPPS